MDGTTAVVGDDGIVTSAAPESAESGLETRVAGPEKPKSVVDVSPKASDVNNEGLFEGLIRPSLVRRVAWIHPDQAKARRAIPVPINNDAVLLLRERLGKHPLYVFSYHGKRITQVSTKAWYAALEKAGIEDFRWHDLRHTWASLHVQAGTPLFALQEMGGWSSAEMVRRYAHLAADDLAPYAEKLCRPLTVVPEPLGTNWSQSAK